MTPDLSEVHVRLTRSTFALLVSAGIAERPRRRRPRKAPTGERTAEDLRALCARLRRQFGGVL